jgi:DNA polymerase gamma 1
MPEEMLTFDVETMPSYHPYAIMACAASKNAWYAWISPWFLNESEDPEQMIPLGDPSTPRVVVGHNVSYDRGRLREEYNLESTKTRFLDTMALHVAVKGISSHQRPAWMKYRKSKEKAKERQEETVEAVVELMHDVEQQHFQESDIVKREELRRIRQDMEETLPQLQADDSDAATTEAEITSKRWEDITSANSLADVAKLHCRIHMDKEIRNDFMMNTPTEIRDNIHDYLNYCANDVFVTHAVFSQALPQFLSACPHPVSFAGILTMGSSFLTVDASWEKYLEDAERTYRELDEKVKKRLVELTEEAKGMMGSEKWREDVWLSQLDWTPKVAGKSRGVFPVEVSTVIRQHWSFSNCSQVAEPHDSSTSTPKFAPTPSPVLHEVRPAWYNQLLTSGPLNATVVNRLLPLLLRLSIDNSPLQYSTSDGWQYDVKGELRRLPRGGKVNSKALSALGITRGLPLLKSGQMTSSDLELALEVASGSQSDDVETRILALARSLSEADPSEVHTDPWLKQLNWKQVQATNSDSSSPSPKKRTTKPKPKPVKPPPVMWPKWYWDLTKPKKGMPPGTLDITARSRIAPILLHLSWLCHPLFHSREHGWTFRVPSSSQFTTRLSPLEFYEPADDSLQESRLRDGFVFYKLPHKDGEKANVGSPLGKGFMKFAQDGTLKSPGDEAKEALDLNAQCSYWISARDRITNQMVVWQGKGMDLGFRGDEGTKRGIILPQVITMGTVTRRAIEKTWLTASNAKKNRVGSELKAMIRAPEGYSIVGADVDSEELWISSCMGDAQFGLHGATAIGWMTLEGTKAAGTDLHSKTANILKISRDQAKVFNYSRIYGAGMRHAVLLLLQSNAGMLPEEAQKLAENLYSSTKGKNTHRSDIFGRKFWFGGTESFVFNKLEEIALSDRPQTPALGCGVTYALSKEYLPAEFGANYMPSRINWVVQSSGVDYLHLLIVSMEHLIAKYNINARYLISVHDELRYLVSDEDRYRAALALQVANLWTRSLFAYKLGMDDLPQGVAFFSAVDVDKVLRKEVDMPCVTPSQPIPIPKGESLDVVGVLAKTGGGSLWKDGRSMAIDDGIPFQGTLDGYQEPNCIVHRAAGASILRAQATTDFAEVKYLAQQASGKKFEGGIGGVKGVKKPGRPKKLLGNGDGVDWSQTVEEELLHSRGV